MKTIFSISLLFFLNMINAQSIEGVWKTIDDETGEPKSHVQIVKKGDSYVGKVVKLLPAATTSVCDECPGDKKGKPIEGMIILEDLKPYRDYYSYGKILDPASGKEYKCNVSLKESDVLEVRGYIGISLIGRSQEWFRVKS